MRLRSAQTMMLLPTKSWIASSRALRMFTSGLGARMMTVRRRRPGALTAGPVTLRPQRNAKAAAR